jgi:hypothetical protein
MFVGAMRRERNSKAIQADSLTRFVLGCSFKLLKGPCHPESPKDLGPRHSRWPAPYAIGSGGTRDPSGTQDDINRIGWKNYQLLSDRVRESARIGTRKLQLTNNDYSF